MSYLNWIPVKKALPFPGPDYLVTDGACCAVAELLSDGTWNFFGNLAWETQEVTHWMPLPDLPKNKETN